MLLYFTDALQTSASDMRACRQREAPRYLPPCQAHEEQFTKAFSVVKSESDVAALAKGVVAERKTKKNCEKGRESELFTLQKSSSAALQSRGSGGSSRA